MRGWPGARAPSLTRSAWSMPHSGARRGKVASSVELSKVETATSCDTSGVVRTAALERLAAVREDVAHPGRLQTLGYRRTGAALRSSLGAFPRALVAADGEMDAVFASPLFGHSCNGYAGARACEQNVLPAETYRRRPWGRRGRRCGRQSGSSGPLVGSPEPPMGSPEPPIDRRSRPRGLRSRPWGVV